tara:strand:- start:407 stop:775 length:369 start_codon:yes stop_codon:yes gene_type:complete
MATNSNWTVIFNDKLIIKQSGDASGTGYKIDDNTFWSQSKFSNIWAIQHGTSINSDEVEYRDETPHSSYVDANIGNIQEFIDKWDSAHLTQLQSDWDEDNVDDETLSEKITRLGARPTSYSS